MASYICIDGGTTNTRISLAKNGVINDMLSYSVGSSDSTEKALLYETVKSGISEILRRNGLKPSDVKRILASGMLTSQSGLCELKHALIPAGIKELHSQMHEAVLKEISDIPFVFMRGLKTGLTDLDAADMLRGEETELMGIIGEESGDCIYILPGSHSKIIKTDSNSRITDFMTMLTGEMMSALSRHTILRDAVTLGDSEINKTYLNRGFLYCKENGINKALFKVRILKNMLNAADDEVYSFFTGAVLCGEITEILKLKAAKIIIGGKKQLRLALFELLKNNTDCGVVCLSDETARNAAAFGMLKIYEYGGINNER